MKDALIELIIILGDASGIVGGAFVIFPIVSESGQWSLALVGAILLILAAIAIYFLSPRRRGWQTIYFVLPRQVAQSISNTIELERRAERVRRIIVAAFVVSAVLAFTIIIYAVVKGIAQFGTRAFQKALIIQISTYALLGMQIVVETALIRKALGFTATALNRMIVAALPGLLEIAGTGCLIGAQADPAAWTYLDDVGLVVGGTGVGLGLIVYLGRIIAELRAKRRLRRVAPATPSGPALELEQPPHAPREAWVSDDED